jgi:hypothetical protein
VGYIIDELDETALSFPKLTADEEAELRRRAETRGVPFVVVPVGV